LNYPESLNYLSSLIDREKKFGIKYRKSLRRFKEHLKIFGNPHKKLRGFLIGGTKGKGSTAHLIEAICRRGGYRTGLFTSPHLVSYLERIKINGESIHPDKFASLVEEVSKTPAKISVFETLTTMAFLFFEREKVDYSIFEVGLGGRLDATNVFTPSVSIMTSISYDHTDILGETLREIASEKAKILRKKKINISAPQEKEVEEILRNEVDGNIEFVKNCKVISIDENKTIFKLGEEEFRTGLIGEVQALNASLAITASRKMGINLSPEKLNEALLSLRIPARFQIIERNPLVVVDGAHNVASIKSLKRTIRKLFKKKVLIVFSCLSDKDIEGIFREIKPITKKIYPTSLALPRGIPLKEIKAASQKVGLKTAETKGFPLEDLNMAKKEASSSDIILVTGSFYLAGEVLKQIKFQKEN
jgi:dihydrofolate synthase/folylpolyglutamate synthase